MKKSSLLIAFLFAVATISQANNEKVIKSNVKNVTVFTQGAQVFRTSTVNLSKGTTDLVYTSISPFINPSSVQAGGKGEFIVLDVKHQIKYPEPPKTVENSLPPAIMKEIKNLEDSLAELGFIREELTDQKTALQLEKDMIMKNKLSNGEGKSDSLPILKQAMEFFRIKLTDINTKLSKIKRDEKKNTEKTASVTGRLNDLKKYKNNEAPQVAYKPVHQIIVTVSAIEATTAMIDISYMVSNAGWTPSYDLRSTTVMMPVELTYKANIFQNTEEEWNDVKLRVSTSNPNRSNIKPALPTWYLDYFTAVNTISGGARGAIPGQNAVRETKATNDMELDEKMNLLSSAQSAANYSQMIETMANVMFDIKLDYSIPSDGETHVVPVKSEKLPSSYYHYLVPKIESEAFLVAKITGWEDLNLLPGKANVFYEGTYVGETILNPAVINDTLQLAFGRDNGVTITRTKQPVTVNNKLIGSDITKTIAYVLKMKNNKSKSLNLIVEDQIPVTHNKEIKVELKDKNTADFNPETGTLKWNVNLEAKKYQTLTFSYAVTYDRNKSVNLN